MLVTSMTDTNFLLPTCFRLIADNIFLTFELQYAWLKNHLQIITPFVEFYFYGNANLDRKGTINNETR